MKSKGTSKEVAMELMIEMEVQKRVKAKLLEQDDKGSLTKAAECYNQPSSKKLSKSDAAYHPTDKRLTNLAWLAEKCFRDETGFSSELDKIVGEHRNVLPIAC